MLIQCERCGAPLEVRAGQSIVTCAFCHASTQLKSPTIQTPRVPVWPAPEPIRARFTEVAPLNVAAVQFAQAQVRRTVFRALGALIAVAVIASVVANRSGGLSIGGLDVGGTPTLGVIDIGPAFPAHFDRAGTAGGSIDASRFGAQCRGHFPRTAHVVLHLRQPAVLSITTANTSTDMTMAIRGPDGSIRCNDDGGEGNNPLVQGQFEAGDSRVWIGTYSSDPSGSQSFTLGVDVQTTGMSALVNGLSPDAPPAIGVIDPDQAPGGTQAATMVLGTVDGSHVLGRNVVSACRGYYAATPTAQLRLSTPRFVSLTTQGSEDLTMLVRSPDGRIFCDDDGGYSQNPLVAQMLPPGLYAVWAGPFARNHSPQFTLSVVTDPIGAGGPNGLDASLPPSLGMCGLGEQAPQTFRGIAAYRVDGAAVDSRCASAGFLSAPHLAVVAQAPRRAWISGDGDGDLRLSIAVRTTDGATRCLTDGGNQDPSGMVEFPAGASYLWVGTVDRTRHAAFTLTVAPVASGAAPGRPSRGVRGGQGMRGGPSGRRPY